MYRKGSKSSCTNLSPCSVWENSVARAFLSVELKIHKQECLCYLVSAEYRREVFAEGNEGIEYRCDHSGCLVHH